VCFVIRRARFAGLVGLTGCILAGIMIYLLRRRILARIFGLRPAEYAVAVELDLALQIAEGVTLYADRYYPRELDRAPTILVRTPYGRPSELGPLGVAQQLLGYMFAERGYNFVIQSVRGRFRSTGVYEPFVHEAADGRATLEWVADQPWFDGKLGLWGASYLGYTQWAVAADAPEYLKAIVPITTSARFSRLFYPSDSFAFESLLRWIYIVENLDRRDARFDPVAILRVSPRAVDAAVTPAFQQLPIHEADRIAIGKTSPVFQRWLNERSPEHAYWRSVDHYRRLAQVGPAVHLVAGWYDIFLHGQLADYAALLAAGHRPYLTILPRAHMDAALIREGVPEGLWWFDAHLQGRRELLDRRPVRLALMGAHEWHEMDFWPPPARITRYYLQAEHGLAPQVPVAAASTDSYCYDPRDPTPAIGGPVLSVSGGPRDQAAVEARADVLTYTTPPLEIDVDVIGPVRMELYVHSSLEHTDFVGRLCDVDPDGRSINVCDGMLRLTSETGELQPDGSRRIEVDMWATAQRFRRRHRIRLQVCSAAHPRWSRHLGYADPIAGREPGPVAVQTIYHDEEHPSALVLPVVHAEHREGLSGQG
jgi:putative CocE/NonD family hydrolase